MIFYNRLLKVYVEIKLQNKRKMAYLGQLQKILNWKENE